MALSIKSTFLQKKYIIYFTLLLKCACGKNCAGLCVKMIRLIHMYNVCILSLKTLEHSDTKKYRFMTILAIHVYSYCKLLLRYVVIYVARV